jgi:hypothetical protein
MLTVITHQVDPRMHGTVTASCGIISNFCRGESRSPRQFRRTLFVIIPWLSDSFYVRRAFFWIVSVLFVGHNLDLRWNLEQCALLATNSRVRFRNAPMSSGSNRLKRATTMCPSLFRKASETMRRRRFRQSDGHDLSILSRVRCCRVTNLFPV